MNPVAEPALNAALAAAPDWVQAQLSALQTQVREREAELKQRDLKIQRLTLELAHYKRMRFGVRSEALSPEQRDLFVARL